ncbi:hypothetical protein STCU_05801 [Strigomonas culicis]|uniref:CFA20 domain-containing protein n=1 Tax=Strigomonas culicis TaxID=28005 RepID=S9UEG8_9TRYP|nr:hypothetical protein STCU_05801 [Strigomonas culicis]|eukprot:EPY27338.1 hypothetical protein STCU_05801 [Strigomonas culicis]
MNSIVKPTASCLASVKVFNPKCCTIEQDAFLKAPVIHLKGDVDKTRIQIPREDRPVAALQLHHSLVVTQIYLNATDPFAMEFTVSQSPVLRTKLLLSTLTKEAQICSGEGNTYCRLPLVIPRNKWVQVIIHVAGIVNVIFSLPAIKTIDSIALMGAAKIRNMLTTNSEDESIDSTPVGMALFAVPPYMQPIWITATSDETVWKNASRETQRTLSTTSSKSCDGVGPADTAAVASQTKKLPVILTKTSVPDSVGTKSPAQMNSSSSATGNTEPQANKSSARQAPYIRFVDKPEGVPLVLKNNNGNMTRRGDGAKERPTNGTNNTDMGTKDKFDVSSWEEPVTYVDVFDTAVPTSKEGDVDEKRPQREGVVDERTPRTAGTRKGRGDAVPSQPPKRTARALPSDVVSLTLGARRQQRAKTRAQKLKWNNQIISRSVIERARLASQVPLNNTPSVADSIMAKGMSI